MSPLRTALICLLFACFAGLGLAVPPGPARADVALLHTFTFPLGTHPSAVTEDRNHPGVFYAVLQYGGQNGRGTIVTFTADDPTPQTLYSFAQNSGYYPASALVQSGKTPVFYGTTISGGAHGNGTVFQLTTDGTASGTQVSALHSFSGSDGSAPVAAVILGRDGNLYGTTQSGGAFNEGTVYQLALQPESFTTLHSFDSLDGANPVGALFQALDGSFYGTAEYGGRYNYGDVFHLLRASGTAYNLIPLYSFHAPDGYYPDTALVQGGDGNLYGATANDPVNNAGTLFRITTNGSFLTTYRFTQGSTGVGSAPSALIYSSPSFFVTTTQQGLYGNGAVSQFNANAQNPTALIDFDFHNTKAGTTQLQGSFPNSIILASDGSLVGTTYTGSLYGNGTLFRYVFPDAGRAAPGSASGPASLFAFYAPDGANPVGALTQASGGNFYGTTSIAGGGNSGTIFQITSSGALTTLHSFSPTPSDGENPDGAFPQTALVEGEPDILYGTTEYGGGHGTGEIFRVTDHGTFQPLFSFNGFPSTDTANGSGGYPAADLLPYTDGSGKQAFYGTALYGGSHGYGTIFTFEADKTTSSVTPTVIANFDYATNGAYPSGRLTPWLNADGTTSGAYVGVTGSGGAADGSGYGTVFQLAPDASSATGYTLTTLHVFNYSDGAAPQAALTQNKAVGTGGKIVYTNSFYGTTLYGGANGYGTAFQVTTSGAESSTSLATIHAFTYTDGANPLAPLVLVPYYASASTTPPVPPIGGFRGRSMAFAGGGGSGSGAAERAKPSYQMLQEHLAALKGGFGTDAALANPGGRPPTGGTIYDLDLTGSTAPTILFDFSQHLNFGSNPADQLVPGTDGYYYGTAEYGGVGEGTVIKVQAASTQTLTPSIHRGGQTFPLTVYGSGFVDGSKLSIAGMFTHLLLSATKTALPEGGSSLTAPVSSLGVGNYQVTVVGPDGKTSQALPLTIVGQ